LLLQYLNGYVTELWVDFKLAGVLEELDITDDVIMVLTVAEGPQARPIFYKNAMNKVT
jgi:hypothetical protein